MQSSQLLATVRTLTKTEWRALRQFVRSPFFNQRADVVQLAEYLAKHAAKPPTDPVFTKQTAWKNIFPGQPYDDKTMRYAMSHLLDAIEHFFAVLEMQADQTGHKLYLFNALRKRGLAKSAETVLSTAEVATTAAGISETAHARSIRHNRRQLLATQNRHAEVPVLFMLEHFTLETVIETLREGCVFLDYRTFAPAELRFPLLDLMLDFCEKNNLPTLHPSIAIHYYAFRMLERTGDAAGEPHYFALKKLLYGEAAPENNGQRDVWLHALNFAIRRQNQGNRAFAQEAFDLYKTGLERGILLEEGHISKKTYSNTLVLSLLAGEWEWAEAFLKEYRLLLPEQEQDNTYRHNLATLFFKKKQYTQVLETLQGVNFTDVLHNLDDRRLLLCSYYELGEFAALESLLDSFAIWLRRAKNLGYHRELYANLVKFTRRLMENKNQPQAREKLRQDILATKAVAAREWLLEKV